MPFTVEMEINECIAKNLKHRLIDSRVPLQNKFSAEMTFVTSRTKKSNHHNFDA